MAEATELAERLNALMAKLDRDQRIEIRDAVLDDYCEYCGSEYLPCHCMNDE